MTSLTALLRTGTEHPAAVRLRGAAPYLLSVWSGVAVFAAFEPLNAASMAYVALIPWLVALRLWPQRAKRISWVGGLACWLPSLYFLRPVTVVGGIVLAMYCALYWIPAGMFWARGLRDWQPQRPLRGLAWVVSGAAAWSLLEWTRGWMLTGFPWNALGTSQVQQTALIQLAAWGGAELISFVLVCVNLGVGLTLLGWMERLRERHAPRMHPELYAPILLLVLSFSFGSRELRRQAEVPVAVMRIAVVQPNIEVKWDDDQQAYIREVLWTHSQLAARTEPDLMLWPETALPDELRFSRESMNLVRDVVSLGAPLLLGTLDAVFTEAPGGGYVADYFNAAMLVDIDGVLRSVYWKRHLVMFGEYMPFANLFPFLRAMTPMGEDVTPGEDPGIMLHPESGHRMGILICFEDLMPGLARDLVAEEAELFVNLTNNAWFDPYWGSRAHLQNAVLRSVESRRPLVRATNTGVSAWVDHRGVVRQVFEDPESGRVRIRGSALFPVEIPLEFETSFYHQHPLRFPLFWALAVLAQLLSFSEVRKRCVKILNHG